MGVWPSLFPASGRDSDQLPSFLPPLHLCLTMYPQTVSQNKPLRYFCPVLIVALRKVTNSQFHKGPRGMVL